MSLKCTWLFLPVLWLETIFYPGLCLITEYEIKGLGYMLTTLTAICKMDLFILASPNKRHKIQGFDLQAVSLDWTSSELL